MSPECMRIKSLLLSSMADGEFVNSFFSYDTTIIYLESHINLSLLAEANIDLQLYRLLPKLLFVNRIGSLRVGF